MAKSTAVRGVLSLVLTLCMSACTHETRDSEPVFAARPVDLDGARIFVIDASHSRLQALVFRGGPLARLGHNHVVSAREVEGRVWLHSRFERSGFELTVPVERLVVDDPQERGAQGPEFQTALSPQDVEGTRRNMLGAQVLDANQFPVIRIDAAEVAGTQAAPRVVARITLKGVTRAVPVPLVLTLDAQGLRARGSFELMQSDFGIKPFSVALGALALQDRVHIDFDVLAVAAP